MSDTTYVDYTTPTVNAAWLNEINDHVWHDTPVQGTTLHAADKIGFVQSGTGSVPRTMQDKARESVSVKDFGAVGDGVTDDTAAIQAAITYCENSSRILDLVGATYRLGKHLDLKGGYSLENGKIFLPKDIDLTGAPTFGGSNRSIYSVNSNGLAVKNIEFYSEKIGLTKLVSIAMMGCDNLSFQSCIFRDIGNATYPAQGLVIFGGVGINIDSCSFSNCAGDGGAIAEGASQIRFTNNVCQLNGDWGFAFSNNCSNGAVIGNLFLTNTSTATGCDECTDFVFTGNVAISNEHGIRISRFPPVLSDQRDIIITGNDLRNNVIGIELGGCDAPSQIVITGNSIRSSAIQGINVVDSAGFVITGNIIQDSTNEAILMISYSSPTGSGTLSGNAIDGCTYGIRMLNAGGSLLDVAASSNQVINASVSKYDGIQGHLIADESNRFAMSKPVGFPSSETSFTASIGGVVSPGNFAGFLNFYVDGGVKKIPYFNP